MARPLNWGCNNLACRMCNDRWELYGHLRLNITDKEEKMPITSNEPKFWLIWNMSAKSNFNVSPTKHHANAMDAGHEASRLAKASPGQKFTVVEAIQTHQVIIPEVTVTRHGFPNDGE